MPDGVLVISDYAFYGSKHLGEILLPDGLVSIGSYAFSYCPIENLVIPASVTYIGRGSVNSCAKLDKITFAEPLGWRLSDDPNGMVGALTPAGVSSPTRAVKLLQRDYPGKYWHRA